VFLQQAGKLSSRPSITFGYERLRESVLLRIQVIQDVTY
jgi:hypothetical protein